MEALKFESFPIHMQGYSDISINTNTSEVISGGNDCVIKIFNLKDKSNKHTYDISDEIRAITFSSSRNVLAYSQGKSVYLVKDMNCLSDQMLITTFSSPVTKISFHEKLDYLISMSEDDDLFITNITTLSTYKHKTQHEGSIKDYALSYINGKLVTSGCDGYIIIVDIKSIYEYNVLKKIKAISKISFEGEQNFGLSINHDNILAISGSLIMKTIDLNNSDYILKTENQISHKNDISLISWINNKYISTADLSRSIKIWNFSTKALLYSCSHNEVISKIEYDLSLKTLVFIDKSGNLNISQPLDLKDSKGNSTYDKVSETSNKLLMNLNKDKEITDLFGKVTTSINEMIESKGDVEMKDDNLNLSDLEDENGEIKPKEEIEQSNKILNLGIEEKRQAMVVSKADKIIDCIPQEGFISGSTDFSSTQARFLCWNLIGSVILREQVDMSYIEIEFSNPINKNKKLIQNDHDFTMAVLNNCGVILACKGDEENLDEYEKETKKLSVIEYKPFFTWSNIKEWKKELPYGENVENLAIGVDWCAVYTDNFFIRLFTFSGIEFFIFSIPNQIISMSGYENLLAYVYTVSPGLFGTQNFRFKIVDISNNFEDIIDDQLPISPYSTLKWFGFSEDGMLITYDSEKIIRGLSFRHGKKWIPLLNLRDLYRSNIWMIGAQDEELYLVDLKTANEPIPFQKLPIRVHKFKIPLLPQMNLKSDSENILNNLIFLNHDMWRLLNYKIFKDSRSSQNADHYYSDNLRDENDIKERKKNIDKMLLTMINQSIIEKQLGIAESLFSFLTIPKSKILCLNMCQQLNQTKLLESLNRRMTIENYKSAQVNQIPFKQTNQSEKTMQVNSLNTFNNNQSNNQNDENKFSSISINLDMYRSVVEEEQNNKRIISDSQNNVKMENEPNNINETKDILNKNSGEINDKKLTNPFIKSVKDDFSKQKNIFEDLSKSSSIQNNLKTQIDIQNFSQKIGFKRKTNGNNEDEKKTINESQLHVSKIKK